MALSEKQITSLLEEIVKGLNQSEASNESFIDRMKKWNSALKESVHMQLLSMTLAASYAGLGQHKNTNYVIDKTMQMGMLIGYLLKEKEQEIESLEKMHEDSNK